MLFFVWSFLALKIGIFWHIVGARGLWRDDDRRLGMFKFASSLHLHDADRTPSLALRVSLLMFNPCRTSCFSMALCFHSALITPNSDCIKCAIWLRSFLLLVTLSAVTKHAACTLCELLYTFGTFWRLVLICYQSLAATYSALSGAF
jgi:hypothetical protein